MTETDPCYLKPYLLSMAETISEELRILFTRSVEPLTDDDIRYIENYDISKGLMSGDERMREIGDKMAKNGTGHTGMTFAWAIQAIRMFIKRTHGYDL